MARSYSTEKTGKRALRGRLGARQSSPPPRNANNRSKKPRKAHGLCVKTTEGKRKKVPTFSGTQHVQDAANRDWRLRRGRRQHKGLLPGAFPSPWRHGRHARPEILTFFSPPRLQYKNTKINTENNTACPGLDQDDGDRRCQGHGRAAVRRQGELPKVRALRGRVRQR